MSRLPLLFLLLVGCAAPLRAQTLIDATTAGAVQGSLNNMAMPSYGGALNAARSALNSSQKPLDRYLGLPYGGAGGTGSSIQRAPMPSTPVAAGTPQPEVNGRVIGLCSSGQLCLSEIRQAMGLR
jgi:hypothetical protein